MVWIPAMCSLKGTPRFLILNGSHSKKAIILDDKMSRSQREKTLKKTLRGKTSVMIIESDLWRDEIGWILKVKGN